MDQKLNKPTLYLKTTVPSYLAARLSRDIVVQAHQQITWDWWNSCRGDYEIYISEIVLKEIAGGDQKAAERRYEFVKDLEILDISENVRQLGRDLAVFLRLPKRAVLKFCNRVRVRLPPNMELCTFSERKSHAPAKKFESEHSWVAPVIITPEELMIGDYGNEMD